MKLELSNNALDTIHNLCDLALKTGGVKNLPAVNALMGEIGAAIAAVEAEAKAAAPAHETKKES